VPTDCSPTPRTPGRAADRDLRGLTADEVAERVRAGRTNDVPARASRGVWEIVRSNVFTRVNAILAVLFAIVVSTGELIDAAFGLLIVVNSITGTVQELRAKRTLDRLAIVGQARPRVRRDGVTTELPPSEVVADDVIELGPGEQIVVDGEIVAADALEVDESLLTGESDPVVKAVGDEVLSGSFVAAGSGCYRATKVGTEAYAAQLAAEAGRFTLVNSELRSGIDQVLRFIGYLLVPAAALSIYNQLSGDQDLSEALRGMVAALVPMVPEGLVLITSIAFAVGVIRLGRQQCLVNELPAIEGLARVDVVCVDKTGTLTENKLALAEVRDLDTADADGDQPDDGDEAVGRHDGDEAVGRHDGDEAVGRHDGDEAVGRHDGDEAVGRALAALVAADPRPNASLLAIGEAYPDDPGWTVDAVAPFSSARKWSGASFDGHGNWVLGAPDVLLPAGSAERDEAQRIASSGDRVLLVGSTDDLVDQPDAPGTVTPRALVMLDQKVRGDAKATLEYFAEQGVTVKVISGDNAASVGAVARSLGLAGAGADDAVDARELPKEEAPLAEALEHATVFGRVTPAQKRAMVGALQSLGHTVAMTGDGVNDVLALKDADIGVAMGSGSPATRAVAQIVLLDDRFATLPAVVAEGRRVIGSIERVAKLFLTKTVYSVLLAILVGVPGLVGFDPLPYPFLPRHVTVTGWFTIGLPAFVLSLAPQADRARRGFVRRVMRFSIPAGIVVGAACFVAYVIVYPGSGASREQQVEASTTALITLIAIALWVLAIVARPYTPWRLGLVAFMAVSSALMFVVPFLQDLLELDPHLDHAGVAAACAAVGIALVELAWQIDRRRTPEPEPS